MIVSGLPRSGTSMMMRMLAAGGMPLLTDSWRGADHDNPHGYFEYEPVKAIRADQSWLAGARGKAVKIVSPLLMGLAIDHPCRILFMQRPLAEIMASQRKMLERRGEPAEREADAALARHFEDHLRDVRRWLEGQTHMKACYVRYHEALASPAACASEINAFLGAHLDERQMAAAVDPALYRQRR
ncbi:MAG: sulfotransferase family protein [Gammaproteobacteria bacterium]